MGADGLVDTREPAGLLAGEFDRRPGDRVAGNIALKQPAFGAHGSVVAAQSFE